MRPASGSPSSPPQARAEMLIALLQMGAQVIKVEPPASGDYLQALAHGRRSYEAMNAGKDIRRIDLNSPEGRAEARALATHCDVLIDSFRPGVLDRHGLAYETLAAVNPGLVHCSISGWGSQQGQWSALGAYDHVMQALTGISLQTGNPGDPPIKVGFMNIDSGPIAATPELHQATDAAIAFIIGRDLAPPP